MEKEILTRGYVTYALTNEKGKIFGLTKDCYINDWSYEGNSFFKSEVYVEPHHMTTIIRQGMMLVDATNEELTALHEQSKVNLT